ncbi:MAG: DUF4160 domain-containing protein [Deltaproteobacteria bacterium]|nr:MAG: DUF4160 domain-containing protein [Deltaproteobacteria bacterium]
MLVVGLVSLILRRAVTGGTMPRISMFYGITVYMYWYDTKRHSTPHFHVRYAGNFAVFDFDGQCLDGKIPKRAERLIIAWARERRLELEYAWLKATSGEMIPWIQPLN